MQSKLKIKRLAAGIVGIALAFSIALPAQAALTQTQVDSIISLLQSFGADASTITNVRASLTGGTPSVPSTPSMSSCTFTRDLTLQSSGADVTCLQNALLAGGYSIPAGATGYFGAQTQAAVSAWQTKSGITPAAGYFGPKSRSAFNLGGSTTGGGTVVVPPTGGGLSVSAGAQPAAQLAPQSASRVPFTRFTLTAGSSDVVVNSVTVTRVGPALDSSFSGVVLVDENGIQIGVAKTLNSNHQANIGEPFTVKAGTTRTLLVAGNMAADLSLRAGEVPAFQVAAINTSASVVGSLPITGTGQVVNATLTVGSVTTAVSSFDPASSPSTQNIGTTGYRFAGIRITAGSAEDIRLHSIRWNQSGSVSANDIANVMTVVDGVKYPTVVSADGKYYTTTFGSGIVLAKGFGKDIYVEGDLVGSGSAGRTVQFDIYKTTDLYLTGETYGYGVTPAAGSAAAETTRTTSRLTTGTPWFQSITVNVGAGSLTTISNAISVAAQNISVNVPNQVLGGYQTDFKGEAVSVQSTIIRFSTSTSAIPTSLYLTNVSIVDENGAVVAGPVDAVADTTTVGSNYYAQKVTFTDTITYPVGKHTYTIKGKVNTSVANGSVYTAYTSTANWSTVTGQTTGNTISLGTNTVTMNPMTVKAASLAVNVSTNPASQSVIAGTVGQLFTNLQFDASQSGEDIRFSSVGLTLTVDTVAVTDVTGCQLFDGTTALNTGSNVVNPDAATETFTFDSSLVVTKGTVKTLGLKCNVSSGVSSGSFRWGITTTQAGAIAATGVTSSNDVDPTMAANNLGPTMSVGVASLATSADSSTPGYTIATAGASDVTLGVIKFRPTNDAVNLQRIGLKLTNTASSSAADLIQVTLWNGATKIGTATFTGTNVNATSTLSTVVNLPKDTDTLITIKGDLTAIGSSQPVTVSGHLLAVDIDNNTNTYGTGVGSGTTVNASGSTAFAGVRIFKTYPTIALGTQVSSSAVAGSNVSLLRFTVKANDAGPVSIAKFTTTLTTVSANATGLNLFGYTDSAYSQGISGVSTGGQLMASNQATTTSANTIAFYPQTAAGATTTIQIPAGQTRYFEVRATTVTGTGTSYSVSAALNGDSAYPAQAGGLTSTSTTAAWIDGGNGQYTTANRSLVWSPNSTTTATVNDVDWTNGFSLPGLPSSGISHTRTQ